jgi:hypothetical protein
MRCGPMETTPICDSVERDLGIRLADLMRPLAPWSFDEFDALIRKRIAERNPVGRPTGNSEQPDGQGGLGVPRHAGNQHEPGPDQSEHGQH